MVWEFRYYETDAGGKRQRRAVTVSSSAEYASESAARKSPAVQALLLAINSERPQAAVTVPSVGALIALYEKEEIPERDSTRRSYKSYIDNYIRKRWADEPVNGLKPRPVEKWLADLGEEKDGKKGLTPKTRSHIRNLMRTIYQCAVRWEIVDRNPIQLVRVPGGSKRSKTPRVLTPAEFCLLPAQIPEPYRTMVWVAGCLGLRVSEIGALRWSDFDFDNNRLLVQRSVVHGKIADVKTEYSRDFVPLDPALIEILAEHRQRWLDSPEGWVFANPVTGRPFHQDTIQHKHIRKAGIAAGLGEGIGWHTFRHSYRSWLDDTGAPIGIQKELMRHASIQTTMNIYGKAISDSKRSANSKVVQMVLKPSKSEEKPDVAATGS